MPALSIAVLVALAAAAPIPPAPTRWVEDRAAFLSPATRGSLDARLEAYERATGHQVVVWIDKTLDGAPLDDWAVRTFASWKIGRRGLDDGIAMFIFADDRTIDIEVGYGLEDKVPDAAASRIIRDVMAPRIRAGDRDGGVAAGVDAVLAKIEGKPWTGTSATAPSGSSSGPSALELILGGLALIVFVIFAITHPRMAMLMLWTIMSSGRGGGRAGGFGGGGFGGGGGRSGGGGARGGW